MVDNKDLRLKWLVVVALGNTSNETKNKIEIGPWDLPIELEIRCKEKVH